MEEKLLFRLFLKLIRKFSALLKIIFQITNVKKILNNVMEHVFWERKFGK